MKQKIIEIIVKEPWKYTIRKVFTKNNLKKVEICSKLVSLGASALLVIIKRV